MPEKDSDVERNIQRAGNARTKPSTVHNCPAPDLSNFSDPQTGSQNLTDKITEPCKTNQRWIGDQTEDNICSSDHWMTLLGRAKRPPRKLFPSGPRWLYHTCACGAHWLESWLRICMVSLRLMNQNDGKSHCHNNITGGNKLSGSCLVSFWHYHTHAFAKRSTHKPIDYWHCFLAGH